MDSVENMQDFNIPSIDHETNNLDDDSSMSEGERGSPSEENKSDSAPAAQETDNEALSSLLMLSKQGSKQFSNEVLCNVHRLRLLSKLEYSFFLTRCFFVRLLVKVTTPKQAHRSSKLRSAYHRRPVTETCAPILKPRCPSLCVSKT